jgi:poly-gamma-glutamate capsule biosynthesis protein CapA/YwtB (metallophosphatase superfamily)
MPALVRRVVAGAVLATLAACTSDAGGEDPAGAPPPPPPSPSPSSGESSEHGLSETAQPRVLVAHHSRGEVRISATLARRIERGRVATWRRLDGSADRLRLATSVPEVARDRRAVAVLPATRVRPWVRPVVVGGVDPLREPDRYPLRTVGPSPGPVTTVTLVGDIMLGRGVAAIAPPGDPVAALRPLRQHLRAADLTVGNLESTLSDHGPPQQGGDSFTAPPAVADGLARLGVDAVSLANNHTGDFGEAALLDTVQTLGRSRLEAFGAGADRSAAAGPVVLRHAGVRFGFVGFNAIGETPRATPTTPGALSVRMPPRTGPVNRADLAYAERVVRRLDRRVDVVVVVPHWGEQYTHVADPAQTLVARRLAGAGAALVVGGHPHWTQGLGRAGDTVVGYSLGNLVFDMDFVEETMEGVTLTATFWGSRLMGVALTPYRMDARFAPHLVDGPGGDAILDDVWANSTGPFSE